MGAEETRNILIECDSREKIFHQMIVIMGRNKMRQHKKLIRSFSPRIRTVTGYVL